MVKCDCDIELLPDPAADADAQRERDVGRLYEKAFAANLDPEKLDDLVHDLASSIAADTNNGGLEAQIRFLVRECGAKVTEKQIEAIIAAPLGEDQGES